MTASTIAFPTDPAQLGDAVGRIAGWTAKWLNELNPNLSREMLTEHFTNDHSVAAIAAVYTRGLADGLTPGDAAAAAGKMLIETWTKAALEAQDEVVRERAAAREAEIDRLLAEDEAETEATGGCPACDTQAIEMCVGCGSCRCDRHDDCERPAE
ncbi:hypothetical protein [Streptomyces sp. NRRL S-350]|uniref:hypothetical protein n=1 Tax=Streptomyces sp. NRRL S-350 TaxID=1463902 RepID=UPI0004BEC51F|nr:hypothetical protein [Streptomyces sp. NRRL S-350]